MRFYERKEGIEMNLPTILVGLVVLGLFVAVVARGIYDRRHGKSSRSCGDCGSCGACSACRGKED